MIQFQEDKPSFLLPPSGLDSIKNAVSKLPGELSSLMGSAIQNLSKRVSGTAEFVGKAAETSPLIDYAIKSPLLKAVAGVKETPSSITSAAEQIKAKTGSYPTIPQAKTLATQNLAQEAGQQAGGALGSMNLLGGAEKATAEELTNLIRGTKGLTADQIMAKHPDLNLKKDIPVTDVYGKKSVIPEGEALTPYELKDGKVVLQDGETYVVSKNQYQNIKGNAISAEAKEFAPELKGTEETVRGKKDVADLEKQWELKASEVNKAIKDFGSTDKRTQILRQDRDILRDQINAATNKGTTKYSSYTLPGGKNYKEVLIKAPQKYKGTGSGLPDGYSYSTSIDGYQVINDSTKKVVGESQISQEKALQNALKEIGQDPIFKSSHWDEPNVISHLRLNERTYNGKPVTFMEELQSDWAREGKDKGFITEKTNKITELPKGWKVQSDINGNPVVVDENGRNIVSGGTPDEAKQNAINYVNKPEGSIPSHPLVKQGKWIEPTVKRALQEAVNNDSEYFSWING
jgi:hypothetical protein